MTSNQRGAGWRGVADPRGNIYQSTEICRRGAVERVPTATVTLAFSAGGAALVADAGANYFWFDIEFDVHTLAVWGPTGATTAPCPARVEAAEIWLVSFLRADVRYEMPDHALVLRTPSAQITLRRKIFHHRGAVPAKPNHPHPLQNDDVSLRGDTLSFGDSGPW